ncbi:MAG: FHA domain-containing protein [Deltaproteobacteria bacterium]|nr:FHA domain-containing protein [Deltaproteobacteria bacterium]
MVELAVVERGTTRDPVVDDKEPGPPVLEVVRGSSPGRRIRLRKSSTVLGRGADADLGFEARGVSRRHARLIVGREGIVNLLDLGSTNGTFVNRVPIDVALVREGDRIALGRHLVLQLSRHAPGVSSVSGEMTPRQLEVARLVALGSTNAEVAGFLGLAPRTIASHLEHIYAQLGIGSRAELTRWLFENGLQEESVG